MGQASNQMDSPTEDKRLFVAIELPGGIRELLQAIPAGISGMNWTSTGAMHLTLRFIGRAGPAQAAAIQAALGQVKAAAFVLRLDGLNFFLRQERAILWAGLQACPELQALQSRINASLETWAALPLPGGPFSPHITLGRMKKANRAALRAFVTQHSPRLESASLTVTSFTLFRSLLTPTGAIHTPEKDYPLLV
jgi:2'-5' RNA ligase